MRKRDVLGNPLASARGGRQTCAACGSVLDRDQNAANIILARARVAVAGWSPAQTSAWEQGKTARLRQLNQAARALIREPREIRDASI